MIVKVCILEESEQGIQRLQVVQYLESSCGNFEIDSMANREPVPASQNWRDMAGMSDARNQIRNLSLLKHASISLDQC